MTSVRWMLVCLPLIGCQFVLDVDEKQCETDTQCVGLFGRNYVCTSERICVEKTAPTADAGAGDAHMPSGLPENWACLREPAQTVVAQQNRFVEMRMQITDFTSGTVPEGLTGKACLASDVPCERPYVEGVTPDADSYLVFTLPHAWRGYTQLSAPGYVDSLIFTNRPFTGINMPASATLLTERSLRSIAKGGGEEIDASKGIVLLSVYDCDDKAAPGVRFEQEDEASSEPPFYFEGTLPDRQRTTTTVSNQLTASGAELAIGGFSQVREGYVAFVATLAETGDIVGRVTVQVRPLTMTVAELHAGYYKRDSSSLSERSRIQSELRAIAEPPRMQIGPYQLIVKIGEGGMGTVWLTKLPGPAGVNKLAVVKELRADLTGSPEFVELFLNEARLAARLTHPNVVHTYGASEDKGRLYIAMEYLDGQPWSHVRHALWSNRSLPLAMHIKVLVDTLAGLHYAHELRDYDGKALEVVHRDMSPQNTFVTYDGQVKLVDFGVARVVTSQPQHAPLFVGKLAYSAPEQLRGGAIDRRADIFGVGVMLWEALAGRRLMEGQDRSQAARRRASEPAPRIREVVPSVPRILETICERALAIDPDDRFATAAEFREALNGYLNETGQAVDPGQIGQLIADAFREERRRINGLIEISLSDVGPPPRPVETLIDTPMVPAGTDHTIRADLSELASVSKLSDEQEMIEASTGASVRIEQPRRTWKLGVGLAVGVVLFLGWLAVRRVEPPPQVTAIPLAPRPEPASATPPPSPIAQVAAQAVPTEVQLTIRASPPSATIYMDGTPLPANPYAARVRSDGEMHLIRVSAPGAQAQERVIALDRDKDLVFTLVTRAERESARPRAATAPGSGTSRGRRDGPDPAAHGARSSAQAPKDPEYDMRISTDPAPRAIYEEDPY